MRTLEPKATTTFDADAYRGVTERQRAVLQFVAEFVEEFGRWPTVRDVCKEFGVTPHGADGHLKALVRKGIITRDEGLTRAINIVGWRLKLVRDTCIQGRAEVARRAHNSEAAGSSPAPGNPGLG